MRPHSGADEPGSRAPSATCSAPAGALTRAETALTAGKAHEQAGRLDDAAREYAVAAAGSPAASRLDAAARAEALRRHASIHRRRLEFDTALVLCKRSHTMASAAGDDELAAEALNGLGLVHLERGEWAEAADALNRASSLGGHQPALRGRIEQNLGIIANMQGDFDAARGRYERSLEAFREARDTRMCAVAYHNLGMINADQEQWAEADRYFEASLGIADTVGDRQLRGNVLLNRTEVHLACQRYEDARRSAEDALGIFDELGVRQGKSEAYKFLGMLYRETGATALAEARLRSAMVLASESGAALQEAEAMRELALLYRRLDRNHDALTMLNGSHRLFQRLGARVDVQDVAGRMVALERIYLELVAAWGRSIESADGYTFGHCERVAGYAGAVALALSWDDVQLTTVRMGAYLHDLGKVRIPHEILNKPGPLTTEEREVMQMHPLWGLELLAAVEFPWQVKPIIRSHHERYDGGGYPDRLRGDEIPAAAQIICVADVYDALTTTRSYRPAFTHDAAIAEMERCHNWWRPDVYAAFQATVARDPGARPQQVRAPTRASGARARAG
jgi:putative nucleotidyltransferase with HDIG domain